METTHLPWIGLVFVAAGIVKGISGMGLPTLSMALLGLFMPSASAAALMVLPSLATNIAQCVGPHWRDLAKRLWPMWLALAGTTVFSPLPGLGDASRVAQATLGVVLVAYGLWGCIKPTLPQPGRHSRTWGGAAGGASGLLTAATGIFVMPLVPYLQWLRLDKGAMIQALGLSFTVATLALMLRLGREPLAVSALDPSGTALALGAAFIGLRLGTRWRDRLPPNTFQRALYAVFIVLGLVIAARTLH